VQDLRLRQPISSAGRRREGGNAVAQRVVGCRQVRQRALDLSVKTGVFALSASVRSEIVDGVAAQPTGTVTLLFTDVEGSTALLAEVGALPALLGFTDRP
jgi:class 3 adenylate cyclase